MSYHHDWSLPYVQMIVAEGAAPLAVPRQDCARCGSSRNPITREITFFGRGTICWGSGAGKPVPEERIDQLERALHRVREQLAGMETSGARVDTHHVPAQLPPAHGAAHG